MEAFPIIIDNELKVWTKGSVWVLRPGKYLRMPRVERPRASTYSIDGALDDMKWIPYDSAVVARDDEGDRLRIMPSGRPPGSFGLITSDIVATQPPWEDIVIDRDH